MVVDQHGKLIYCNAIANQLLQKTSIFCFELGALSLADQDNAKQLKKIIASCITPNANSTNLVGGEITLKRYRQAPLHIRAIPFPQQPPQLAHIWSTPEKPRAILVIHDLEHERTQRKTQLQQHFSLTPAEAELALEILQGDGREAAAARLGITTGTARIHLQRVFQKLGVHRQAEFVRFITELFKSH